MLSFCPLASGSSGNSAFLSSGNVGLLIDAGLSGITLERSLEGIGAGRGDVHALFLTHEHSDHVSGAGVISRRFDIPVYATEGTWLGMEKMKSVGAIRNEHKRVIAAGEIVEIGDVRVMPFPILHDANEPVGYRFETGSFVIATATDMGEPTDEVRSALEGADVLLLESNHDVDMLRSGKYPWHLKKRILSEHGHLSNVMSGMLLADIFTDRLKYVFLAHLSEENNRPRLAFDTVCRVLNANGIVTNAEGGVRVSVAERFAASVKVTLE